MSNEEKSSLHGSDITDGEAHQHNRHRTATRSLSHKIREQWKKQRESVMAGCGMPRKTLETKVSKARLLACRKQWESGVF